ncbi:MAG: ROK family protein, partial [Alphaproteobacteria bacterium]
EWGHNPLPPARTPPSGGGPVPAEWPGPPCWCGRSGCIETLLSGPGMARDHARHTGRDLTAAAIATVVNLFDPDAVVLGGGLSQVASLYVRVPALWGAHIFSDRVDTRLVPPRHGDSSGVRGAARLWATEGDAR